MSRRQKFADRGELSVARLQARHDVSRRRVFARFSRRDLGRRQARVFGAKIRELVGPRRLRAGGPVDPVEDRLRAGEVELARDDEEASPAGQRAVVVPRVERVADGVKVALVVEFVLRYPDDTRVSQVELNERLQAREPVR